MEQASRTGVFALGNLRGNPGYGGTSQAKGSAGNAGNAQAKGRSGNAGNSQAKGNSGNAGNTRNGADEKPTLVPHPHLFSILALSHL